MKDKQLDCGEWKAEQAQCSRMWSEASQETKAVFHAKAREENNIREEASQQPFLSKSLKADPSDKSLPDKIAPAAFDAAELLGRKAQVAVSRQRVFATYKRFKGAECWADHDAGLSTADGALSLDLIDLQTLDTSIEKQWESFACPETTSKWVPDADCEIHHSTCWASNSCCKKIFRKTFVDSLVSSMATHMDSGTSPMVYVRFRRV